MQINLAEEANASQHTELDMSEAYPWALELTTGEKCQAVDEGQTYDGLKVHYQCDSHSVLLGKIQRCKATWSVLQRTTAGVSMVLVTRAWF